MFNTKPVHSWSSHYCDAVRVMATGFEGLKNKRNKQQTAITITISYEFYRKIFGMEPPKWKASIEELHLLKKQREKKKY